MPEWLVIVLLALASYRVVRLVTLDEITEPIFEPLRQRLENRWIERRTSVGSDERYQALYSSEWNSKLAYLLSCAWCLGLWLSGVGTVLVSLAYGLDYPILTWLAVSTMVGLLGRIDSD